MDPVEEVLSILLSSEGKDFALANVISQNKKLKRKHSDEMLGESSSRKSPLSFPSSNTSSKQETEIIAGSSDKEDAKPESMDILPFVKSYGASGSKSLSHSPENAKESDRPGKSQELQNQDDDDENKFEPSFEFLPDVVLFKIFEYLTVEQRCLAARVCNNWYRISRNEFFWKRIQLVNISVENMHKFIEHLPPCVTHLSLNYIRDASRVDIVHIFSILPQRCPSIQAFVLEGVGEDIVKDYSIPLCLRFDFDIIKCLLYFLPYSYEWSEDDREHVEAREFYFPELTVLSLQNIRFGPLLWQVMISPATLPNIKVLHLSPPEPTLNEFFLHEMLGQMIHLEEFYAPGFKIVDASVQDFLRNVKKLRILDLECTCIKDSTISILKRNGKSLEELYIGKTFAMDIFDETIEETEVVFPRLQKICLTNNAITYEGIEKLINECPMLTHVYVHKDFKRPGRPFTHRMQEKLVFENLVGHHRNFRNVSR